MKKYPKVVDAYELIGSKFDVAALIKGQYVPARSMGWPSFTQRIKCAWLVFTGRADALVWKGQ
jgi:hypothetical protein